MQVPPPPGAPGGHPVPRPPLGSGEWGTWPRSLPPTKVIPCSFSGPVSLVPNDPFPRAACFYCGQPPPQRRPARLGAQRSLQGLPPQSSLDILAPLTSLDELEPKSRSKVQASERRPEIVRARPRGQKAPLSRAGGLWGEGSCEGGRRGRRGGGGRRGGRSTSYGDTSREPALAAPPTSRGDQETQVTKVLILSSGFELHIP